MFRLQHETGERDAQAFTENQTTFAEQVTFAPNLTSALMATHKGTEPPKSPSLCTRKSYSTRYIYNRSKEMPGHPSADKFSYNFAFSSGESTLSSTLRMILFVCSASVRVRIY